jgi:hypothetical protein
MLRAALALLSTLQLGGQLRQSFERSLQQALIVAVAVGFLIAAAAFGLLAAYRQLVSIYQPPEAAVLMALPLLFLGFLALGALPLVARKRKSTRNLISPGGALNPIDEGMRNAVRQIGPFSLVLIAFAAGVLAGRR